jgi:integrase
MVKVTVVRFSGREHLMLRYTDPITKKRVHKSAETASKKDAERAAALWEQELNNGSFKPASAKSWEEFRHDFETEHLAHQSNNYWSLYQATFNGFEKLTGIVDMADAHRLMHKYEVALRKTGVSTNTVQTYIKHMRSALYWAAEHGYIQHQKVKVPAGSDDPMKGRAIEDAEFSLMLAAVEEVIPDYANEWKHYLNGLWLSGLRRSESLALSWDASSPFCIHQSDMYWKFRIRATAQKNRKGQLCVMTPDFAEWLQKATPKAERVGLVFNPVGFKGDRLTDSEVGRMISAIGRKAGIVTDAATDKCATAHDLRRSFGTRWASRVMPADLKELMRHDSIETTMKYYVSQETDKLAARLVAATAREKVANKPEARNESLNPSP